MTEDRLGKPLNLPSDTMDTDCFGSRGRAVENGDGVSADSDGVLVWMVSRAGF